MKTSNETTIGERFFDIILFFYFCAFIIFNNDELDVTGHDSIIRILSTLLLFFSGSYLVFENNKGLWSKIIYFKTYFCFVFFGLSSVLWAENTQQVFTLVPPFIRILFISVFLAARINNESGFKSIFNIYITSIFVKVFYVGNIMFTFYGEEMLSQRFGQNFGFNPNEIAMMCVCATSMLIYYYFNNRKISYKVFDVICILFFVGIVLMTQSRKGLTGIIISPLLYFLFSKGLIKTHKTSFLLLVVLLVIFIINSLFVELSEGAFERLDSLLGNGTLKDNSTIIREHLISRAMNIWYNHPIVGIGLNNFAIHSQVSSSYYSHNNYTELLAGLGIIGFFLYYVPILRNLSALVLNRIKSPIVSLVVCLVLVLLFLDYGNVSYQNFVTQVIYVLLSLCFFYKRRFGVV